MDENKLNQNEQAPTELPISSGENDRNANEPACEEQRSIEISSPEELDRVIAEARADMPASKADEAAQAKEEQSYSFKHEENVFVNPGKMEMTSSYQKAFEPTPKPKPEENHEASGIVYTTAEKSQYSCNYVAPTNPKAAKADKKKKSASATRVMALIIAALFTLTFMAYTGAMFVDMFGEEEQQAIASEHSIAASDNNDSRRETQKLEKSGSVEQILSVNPDGTIPSEGLTINQIAEKCTPSAVGIMVESTSYDFFGRAYTSGGVGSGFILTEDGYIATNNHVVSGATKITVVLNDETEYEAKLIGGDSVTDIAVVKIEATGLPVMERGNSDNVKVGDLAVAIGTPASLELAGTVTDGIISAVNRKIDITDSYGRVVKTMNLIQTNATINPGNSGGPLINRHGQVIGINTLKLTSQYEGIGFAIPINGALSIINQLITDGKVTDRSDGLVTGNASIGIQCSEITKQEADYYGTPVGVLVVQINKSSSAASAGLRRGDIITKFEGEAVETVEEINEIKNKHKPGDIVKMEVYRDGEGTIEITFKLDMQVE